jgi:hypothetical protein
VIGISPKAKGRDVKELEGHQLILIRKEVPGSSPGALTSKMRDFLKSDQSSDGAG